MLCVIKCSIIQTKTSAFFIELSYYVSELSRLNSNGGLSPHEKVDKYILNIVGGQILYDEMYLDIGFPVTINDFLLKIKSILKI